MARSTLYFPHLDQARFFAFLAIFLVHCFEEPSSYDSWFYDSTRLYLENGHLGVDFFFCLSAFLITYLLLGEKSAGHFNLRHFYLRRVLRIWPLYFLIVLISFGGLSMLSTMLGQEYQLPEVLPFLLFYSNFCMLNWGVEFFFPLSFLWTIAIEEQFYLIWGAVLKWFSNVLVPICIGMLGIHILYKFFFEGSEYFHSFTYLPYFAMGSVAAYYFNKGVFLEMSRALLFISSIGLVLLAVFLPWLNTSSVHSMMEQLILSTLFAMLIVALALRSDSDTKIGALLTHLGRVSYGLYLWHPFALLLVFRFLNLEESFLSLFVLQPILALGLTVGMAELSYRLYEIPFLRIKSRFSP